MNNLLESIEACSDSQVADRILGCAYGQALGDAYGLSTEFLSKAEVSQFYPDTSIPVPFPSPKQTQHSSRWKTGDWTDDTDQWLLVLETLLEHDSTPNVFARKLTLWVRQGFPDLDDFGGLGLGINVAKVICSKDYIQNPLETSRLVWEESKKQAAPNGGVMRCSACALVHYDSIEQVKSAATWICQCTHFDPRCVASCLAVCLAVAYLLRTPKIDDIESIIDRVEQETIQTMSDQFTDEQRTEFLWYTNKDRTLQDLQLDERDKIGYTYKCMASGFYGLRSTRSFSETLNDLIREGGDADTNGAVCGSLYGARYGIRALPLDWIEQMPHLQWFHERIVKLIK